MSARLATATALLLAFGGALALAAYGWEWAWGALILAALAVGMFEWGRLLGLGRVWRVVYAVPVLLFVLPELWALLEELEILPFPDLEMGLYWLLTIWLAFLYFWVVWLIMLPFGALLCSRFPGYRRVARVVWGLGGLWIMLVAAGVMMGMPWSLVLFLLLVVAATDAAAFWAGRRFGRRLLAPRISPGKTWVGLGAGLAGAGLVGALLPLLLLAADTPRVHWDRTESAEDLLFGLVIGACVVVGDLAVSLLKRAACVKDSGRLLPGHGGVLDRIDGFLLAAPVCAFITTGTYWSGFGT